MNWEQVVKIKKNRYIVDQKKAQYIGLSQDEIYRISSEVAQHNQLIQEIEWLSPHMKFENGNLNFDAKKARQSGLPEKLINQTVSDLQKIKGHIQSSDSFSIMVVKPSCSGSNKTISRWYGKDVYMDSCKANKLSALIGGGATAASVGAAITAFAIPGLQVPATITSFVFAIMAIGSNAISYANAEGCGVIFRYTYGGSLPFWVSSQCG
ncbi:hypothetical protein [Brevibacillus dissolubilis]|uniref:hypothetical protein n=1 Tax=Brevibacillus dissolubilis TaxID=1844116 RepID=UPI0011169B63|nr:hypothetical protein [Brevibacillus dissolubilis]